MNGYCCILWGRKNEIDGVDGMAASISRRASIGRGTSETSDGCPG